MIEFEPQTVRDIGRFYHEFIKHDFGQSFHAWVASLFEPSSFNPKQQALLYQAASTSLKTKIDRDGGLTSNAMAYAITDPFKKFVCYFGMNEFNRATDMRFLQKAVVIMPLIRENMSLLAPHAYKTREPGMNDSIALHSVFSTTSGTDMLEGFTAKDLAAFCKDAADDLMLAYLQERGITDRSERFRTIRGMRLIGKSELDGSDSGVEYFRRINRRHWAQASRPEKSLVGKSIR